MEFLPITAIIVGFNESILLPKCLDSLKFCQEKIYIDLYSTDNSADIAIKAGCSVFYEDRNTTPSCEMAQSIYYKSSKFEWIILIDPDEVIDDKLRDDLIGVYNLIKGNDEFGAVYVPWQFYFLGRKLRGTPWGGRNEKFLLIHKDRFMIEPVIHYGRYLKKEFKRLDISLNKEESNVLHHYWMNDISVFFKKHLRYIKNEGPDRFNMGNRTSLVQILKSPFLQFYFSFSTKKGYKDGILGFFLSSFWSLYQMMSLISLYKFTIKEENN